MLFTTLIVVALQFCGTLQEDNPGFMQNIQNALSLGSGSGIQNPLTDAMKNISSAMNMGSSPASGGGSNNSMQGIIQNVQTIVTDGAAKSPITGIIQSMGGNSGANGLGGMIPSSGLPGNSGGTNTQSMGQMMGLTGGAMQLLGGMQGGPMGEMTKQTGSALSTISGAMKENKILN